VLDGRHDGIAVQLWLAGEDFEDEKIERALHGVCFFHTKTS
jgi:type VI protein secretion system component VasA